MKKLLLFRLNYIIFILNLFINYLKITDITSGQCFGEDDMLKERLTTVNAISMSQESKAYKINKNVHNYMYYIYIYK